MACGPEKFRYQDDLMLDESGKATISPSLVQCGPSPCFLMVLQFFVCAIISRLIPH